MKALTMLFLVCLCVFLLSEVDCQNKKKNKRGNQGRGGGRGNGRGRGGNGGGRGGNGGRGRGRGGGSKGNGGKNKDKVRGVCKCNDTMEQAIDVYTGTGDNDTFTTICVPKHVCYKTCATTPCELPTVVCEPLDTLTVKPGTCPKYYFPKKKGKGKKNRGTVCENDDECRGTQKCCNMAPSNESRCIDPVPVGEKCGSCPSEASDCRVKQKDRDTVCTSDEECPGKLKCCQCQDIKKCVKPTLPHTLIGNDNDDDDDDNDNDDDEPGITFL